jgi:excinuclease UvrABC nuclease subunit
MKKTKLIEPYYLHPVTKTKKTVFNKRNLIGVYEIWKNGELRYVGVSTHDLYKTMYRHFQSWDVTTQTRVQYKQLAGIKVRVIYCNTPTQALNLEKALIIKKKPKDNPHQYNLYTTDDAENKVYNEYTGEEITPLYFNKKTAEYEEPF